MESNATARKHPEIHPGVQLAPDRICQLVQGSLECRHHPGRVSAANAFVSQAEHQSCCSPIIDEFWQP